MPSYRLGILGVPPIANIVHEGTVSEMGPLLREATRDLARLQRILRQQNRVIQQQQIVIRELQARNRRLNDVNRGLELMLRSCR